MRENWKWRKPLKFLGLEYDGATKTLRASTREGATIKFDKQGLVDTAQLAKVTGRAVNPTDYAAQASDYYLV